LMMLGARILAGDAAPDALALATAPAGIACAVAHRLRSFPLDVSRRQMFVPLELLERHGVSREDVEAHRNTRALQAALADLRAHARAAYRQFLDAGIPDRCAPAFLAAAVVPTLLARLDRAAGDPFTPVEMPQWRRQWAIWRAARRWPRV
jgi:15-cis-phytoene synthase